MKIIVRIIVSILILILASASVANIHTRAVQLHADGGWQTWFISVGMAVGFALFAYMLIAFKKPFFFLAALFCALLTGVMQTGMYLTLGADWVTSLGFGCGLPVLEALLAVSEHYMDEPTKRQSANPLLLRLGNAVASRIERPAVSVAQPVAEVVALNVAKPANTPATEEDATDRRNRLLVLLQQHGDVGNTEFGNMLKVDRTTVYRDLKAMEKAGIVHKNGNGWEVLS